MIVLPPGSPPAASAALAEAIRRVNHDKAYAEEAEKSFGYVPQWEATPDINTQARLALSSVKPEVRAFLADYIKAAGK